MAPYPLTLPGCSTLCPLDKFKQLTRNIVPDNWTKECSTMDNDWDSDEVHDTHLPFGMDVVPFLTIVICGFLFIILLVFIFTRNTGTPDEDIWISRNNNRYSQRQYERIPWAYKRETCLFILIKKPKRQVLPCLLLLCLPIVLWQSVPPNFTTIIALEHLM